MLSRFRKPSRGDEKALIPSAPPPDYFGLDTPSIVGPVDVYTKETLKVQVSLEVRCDEEFRSLNEVLHALEVWVDENTCPIWQVHLDTWCYLCLAVHMRKDPTCTYTNLYKASFMEVVEFKHHLMVDQPVTYIMHEQRMEARVRGAKCEIRYTSRIEPTKRKGVMAHVLYKHPLKDGSYPPSMEIVAANFPLEVMISEEGEHLLKFELP
ncbi:matrix [Barur virus]|uniref:Matrix protein n=1 Tax=Barur virus TaxID=380438 RepID=A0A0D3R125_9RHAB|nr:matrix [Barur virus]AJR28281.1 matrix [Barur virus]